MRNTFLLFLYLPFFTQAQFIELSPMPEPVANNAVVAAEVNGQQYVYSFTGIDSTKIWSGTHLKSWRYDVTNDEWTALPDAPDPNGGKIAAWASEVKGKIYLIGGYHVAQNGSESSSVKTHVFDPVTNDWLPDAADIPLAIDDQVQAAWRDSLIYVVTGWSNSGNVTAVQVFNPAENDWMAATSVPNEPPFRVFGASGVIIGDTIFYAGGARFGSNFPATTHFRKGIINPDDPSEIEWSGWQETSARGYRMAAVESSGKAYWLGGSDVTYNYDGIAYNGTGGVPPLDRITVYDPQTNGFFQKNGDMPPVMDLRGQGQITENQVVIAGGMESNQEVTNRTWLIDLGSVSSVKPPRSPTVKIEVYPNPATHFFTVEYAGHFDLKIFDESGKVVSENTGYGKLEMPTKGWGSGLFWLEVKGENGRAVQKVFVEK